MSFAVGQAPDWKQWEGDSVDGFPLQELLGRGDKSAVFRTTFNATDAAIKLVPAAGAQAGALIEHQVEEWNRAQALDDPHFIRIFKTGSWSTSGASFAYAVMEYAEENLAAVLAERPLSASETSELIPPLTEALAFLHRQGLAHGRLKPSNVLAVNDALKLSSDSVTLGTTGAVSQDLRGLAELIVQALTQRTDALSRGDSESRIVNGVPPDLAEIVRNCSGHNGRAQWSAAELLSWLASPRRTLVAASAPVSTRERVAEASGPKLTRLAMGLGLIALVVLVGGSILKSRSADPAPTTTAATLPAAKPAAETPSAPPPVVPKPKERAAKTSPPQAAASTPASATPSSPAASGDASGQIALQVLPAITDKARQTVHGTVVIKIQVKVDPSSGEVTDATMLPTGSRYLGKLSLEAARKWRFALGSPAMSLLRFVITREDTKVSVERSRER